MFVQLKPASCKTDRVITSDATPLVSLCMSPLVGLTEHSVTGSEMLVLGREGIAEFGVDLDAF